MNDLIKRQSAIDALDTGNLTISGEMNALAVTGYLNRVIKRLENLPGENDGWIPCSERLPERGVSVLISHVGYVSEDYLDIDNGSMYFWNSGIELYEELKNLAWMPMPEPWKGEPNG